MTAARLLVPLSLALLTACASNGGRNLELNENSECPQRLRVGQTLSLSLPSNPSTGYRWHVADAASGVLRSLGPELYSTPEAAGIVGSAGVTTWRFQASAAGEGALKLLYQQPWAPEVLPVETFDCAVQVK